MASLDYVVRVSLDVGVVALVGALDSLVELDADVGAVDALVGALDSLVPEVAVVVAGSLVLVGTVDSLPALDVGAVVVDCAASTAFGSVVAGVSVGAGATLVPLGDPMWGPVASMYRPP